MLLYVIRLREGANTNVQRFQGFKDVTVLSYQADCMANSPCSL